MTTVDATACAAPTDAEVPDENKERSSTLSKDWPSKGRSELSELTNGSNIIRAPNILTSKVSSSSSNVESIEENTSSQSNGVHRLSQNTLTSSKTTLDVMSPIQPSELEQNQETKELDQPAAVNGGEVNKISKLDATKLVELTSAPDALPLQLSPISEQYDRRQDSREIPETMSTPLHDGEQSGHIPKRVLEGKITSPTIGGALQSPIQRASSSGIERPSIAGRAVSSPMMKRKVSSNKTTVLPSLSIPAQKTPRSAGYAGHGDSRAETRHDPKAASMEEVFSPDGQPLPVPPFSLSTHLYLELSSSRPSPLYIHRQQGNDLPFESSEIKLERLLNFLLLPPMLEQTLWFGALACFDAWLYTFTILPLRFCKASAILAESWVRNLAAEARYILHFIYVGIGRVWRRRNLSINDSADSRQQTPAVGMTPVDSASDLPTLTKSHILLPEQIHVNNKTRSSESFRGKLRHRRSRSGPSDLLPVDKADILKGLLIIISCYILMYFDASMMYHNIRGQAAIKLYVIYNALEVFDRLLSALGQDVLECLFANETLDRKPNGRSKLIRPAWLFVLALVYNIVHSLALFYQVITLNVAVNSYSNALLTLLMSNQFVEIKGTVFKKIEKENLFQMTCADIVERFQLWLMLIIIASRNIVETGGLSGLSGSNSAVSSPADQVSNLLPHSFTLLPEWTGVIMGPFVLVLGTEMLVDWIKHAYITKFNGIKPNVYGRYLDVLAKDYYSRAFTDPDLTRRVGLATIPLSCLFIRASVQTYHMFLATHTSTPLPSTTSLDNAFASPETTPAIRAAIQHVDNLFKRALFGAETTGTGPVIMLPWLNAMSFQLPALDTVLTHLATILFFTIFFLLLLILKILLGMTLLSYARARYGSMQKREKETSRAESKRLGGWGMVEVDDERRRRIYEDDSEDLKKIRDREKDTREREGRGNSTKGLAHVERYAMVAKRIW